MKESKESEPLSWQLDYRLHRAKLRLKRGSFSNFDEEEILRRYCAELLPEEGRARVAVDLGAGDGVKGSNTYALFRAGWRGLGVEADRRKARKLAHSYEQFEGVSAARALVTPENVVGLLEGHGVPAGFDVLSLDIDSYDYLVLDRLLAHFRPRLVVTEINEKIPPPIKFHVKFDPDFQLQHHFFGYSIQSLADLCARHDYTLLELEYNNAFLAPRELAGGQTQTVEEIYRRGYRDRPDRREKFASNHDVDALHAMSPAEAVRFLDEFYARHRGKYELGL